VCRDFRFGCRLSHSFRPAGGADSVPLSHGPRSPLPRKRFFSGAGLSTVKPPNSRPLLHTGLLGSLLFLFFTARYFLFLLRFFSFPLLRPELVSISRHRPLVPFSLTILSRNLCSVHLGRNNSAFHRWCVRCFFRDCPFATFLPFYSGLHFLDPLLQAFAPFFFGSLTFCPLKVQSGSPPPLFGPVSLLYPGPPAFFST